jgi:glycosyltransferase involved in cell wall biosynthesis
MISVIIPLYNNKKTIEKTVKSILSQTYRNLEIIMVDDASDDGGAENIKKFNGRIKVFYGDGHHGANWARNFGARRAEGNCLFFCDADVILKKNALEILKKTLDKNKNASFAYSSFKLGWKKFISQPFDAEALRRQNYISTMSLISRKDFPGFDEHLEKFQDWDLWLTILKRGGVGVFVPEILFYAKPSRRGKSKWFPSFFYKIPWNKLGIKIKALEEYDNALKKIEVKHGL